MSQFREISSMLLGEITSIRKLPSIFFLNMFWFVFNITKMSQLSIDSHAAFRATESNQSKFNPFPPFFCQISPILPASTSTFPVQY